MHSRQDRVIRDEAPQQLCEHIARYRFATAVLSDADVWFDLGCGSGVAAAAALDKPFAGELVLVDGDTDVLQTAAETVPAATEAKQLCVNLAKKSDVDVLRKRFEKVGRKKTVVVTCFELLPHLENFEPLVGLLVELVADREITLLISVPNDDYLPQPSEARKTVWGEASLSELETFLPEHRVFKQHPLAGSRIAAKSQKKSKVTISSALRDTEPSNYIIAIGSGCDSLEAGAEVASVDLAQTRRWENTREADLAWLNRRVVELEAELTLLRAGGSIVNLSKPPDLPTGNGSTDLGKTTP